MSTPIATLTAEEAYRRWAPTYDATENPLLALEERCLFPKLGFVTGSDVLDIGCGTGRWLKRMNSLGARSLQGVDSSAAMLSIAQKSCPSQTRLYAADATSLPLSDASVDLVIGSFVLSYIRFFDTSLGEVARVLRPGGRLVLSDLHPQARAHGWQSTFRFRESVYAIATYSYTLPELWKALTSHEFSIDFREEPYLGEPERDIFVRSGKEDLFSSASGIPAIYIAGLRKQR